MRSAFLARSAARTFCGDCSYTYAAASTAAGTRGTALTEFLIVLPLIVMLMTGIVEMGKVFSELGRLNQTGFEIARRASEIKRDETFTDTKVFKDYIVHLHEQYVGSDSGGAPSVEMTSKYQDWNTADLTDQTIALGFTVHLNSLMRRFFPSLKLNINAPYLRRSLGSEISSTPKNGDQVVSSSTANASLFDCDGVPTGCTTGGLLAAEASGDSYDAPVTGFNCLSHLDPCAD